MVSWDDDDAPSARRAESAGPTRVEPSPTPVDLMSLLRETTPRIWITPLIVVLNAAVFGIMVFRGVDPMHPTVDDLVRWGANAASLTTGGEWWRLGSCMFLHVGALHIAFNMWVLSDLGAIVERLVGSVGFLLLYVLSGLLASVASVWWNPTVVSAGASGAVFGVLGALLALVMKGRESMPMLQLSSLRNSAIAFLGYNLLYGMLRSDIDMAAHLGGLVAGFGAGWLLSGPDLLDDTGRRTERNAVLTGVGVAALVAALAAVPTGAGDFHRAMSAAGEVESRCVDLFNAALDRARQGEIDDAELAVVLTEEILPEWRAARADLQALSEVPEPLVEPLERLRRYMELRGDSWEIMARALTAEGELVEDLYERAEAKASAAQAILEER